jgi:hypothetical protein
MPASYPMTCGHCGKDVGAEIVHADGITSSALAAATVDLPVGVALWLRCPVCGEGSVRTKIGPRKPSVIYPGARPGRDIPNLPRDLDAAWGEARSAYSVGAYTAAEMMCRKILMHLAVDVAKGKPGKSFVQYIDDLESSGYIMAGLKPVVDQVRDRGNKANHELPASTEQDSRTTLTITQHLLIGIYELPALNVGPLPVVVSSATP